MYICTCIYMCVYICICTCICNMYIYIYIMGRETTRRLLIVGVINHLIRIHRRVHVCQLYIRVALQKHILAYIRKHAHNIIDMHTVTSMHTHGLFTQSCSRFSLVFRGAHSLQKSSCLAGKQTSCLHVVHPPIILNDASRIQ